MSKGINFFNQFNPPKSDGHKIINFTMYGVTVFCPKINDNTTGTHTSNGTLCTCGKMIY